MTLDLFSDKNDTLYLEICDRGNTNVPDLITIHESRLDFLQGVPIIDFSPCSSRVIPEKIVGC